MNLRTLFYLILPLLPISTMKVYGQIKSLKDIVLTYDLKRKTQKEDDNKYAIERPQLVHIEPICENPNLNGSFCAVMLNMNKRRGKGGGTVQLVHLYDTRSYYSIQKAKIVPDSTNKHKSNFVLEITLSRLKGLDSVPLEHVSKEFMGSLSGKRMDVDVTFDDPNSVVCDARKNPPLAEGVAPPWVCRFVFN